MLNNWGPVGAILGDPGANVGRLVHFGCSGAIKTNHLLSSPVLRRPLKHLSPWFLLSFSVSLLKSSPGRIRQSSVLHNCCFAEAKRMLFPELCVLPQRNDDLEGRFPYPSPVRFNAPPRDISVISDQRPVISDQ